jgi:predicted component of type VI protein secretion system
VTGGGVGDPVGPSVAVLSPDGDEILTVRLDTGSLRIGRERHNDVVLGPDPQQLVSREHCVIERVGQRWWVRDLDSRNHVYVERGGQRVRVDRAELLHGDAVCVTADAEAADAVRHWRLAFSDPEQTQIARSVSWLQYYPESGTVWVLGGLHLPRRVDAPPKARRMLLFMLGRYRELEEPSDGVVVSLAELKRVLWPEDADPQRRADSAVANVAWELRPALGDEDQRLLQTVRDEGYRLIPRPKL